MIDEEVYSDDHRKLRSFWSEVHHISTRYSPIILAVKAPISSAIFQSVSECGSKEWRWIGRFRQFWQRPLSDRKKRGSNQQQSTIK